MRRAEKNGLKKGIDACTTCRGGKKEPRKWEKNSLGKTSENREVRFVENGEGVQKGHRGKEDSLLA